MKIGKYLVTTRAQKTQHGDGFVGSANLVWDEGDATLDLAIHFFKSLPTVAEAEQHAREQVELRVRDGKL